MRAILPLFLAFVTASCASARPPSPDPGADAPAADVTPDPPPPLPSLVVVTFNLRTAWGKDGDNGWEFRKDLAADVIRKAAPDVMGTQEGLIVQCEDLAERLPEYAWVGEPRSGALTDEYEAIFYRTDRFELVETRTLALSDTPEDLGSLFSDAQNNPRALTWAHLRDRKSRRDLFVFNTHFDTSDVDDIRLKSAALLVKTIAAVAGTGPVVATGDFNDAPGSGPWNVLTGAQSYAGESGSLVDSWTELGLPDEPTTHQFTGVPNGNRIDWILHSPGDFKAVEAEVLHDHDGIRYPSDHFPVKAVMECSGLPAL